MYANSLKYFLYEMY